MSTSIIRDNGTSLVFDAATEVKFDYGIAVTDLPIEDGSTVSDHSQSLPLVAIVTGLVSNAPFEGAPNANPTRQKDAVEFLLDIRGELVSLTGGRFDQVDNLLITGLPHTWSLAPFFFDVSFKQVDIATAGTVFIDTTPSFQSPTDSGEQSTAEAPEQKTSLLKRGLNVFGS